MVRAWLMLPVLLCGVTISVSAIAALQTLGRPYPSLFVDPFGDYSMLAPPDWPRPAPSLRPLDRIVAVDSVPLSAGPIGPQLDTWLQDPAKRTDVTASLRFTRSGTDSLDVTMPVQRLGVSDLWQLYALNVILAVLLLWSGVNAVRVAGRRPAAISYLLLAVISALHFTTLLDYHTTRWLAPIFGASLSGHAWASLLVALTFPEPIGLLRRHPKLLWAIGVTGVGCIALSILSTALLLDLPAYRAGINLALPLSWMALGASCLIRLRASTGRSRLELRAASIGLLAAPVILASAFTLMYFTGWPGFYWAMLLIGPLLPAGIGYALIRHNILRTREFLTPGFFLIPSLVIATVVFGLAWQAGAAFLGGDEAWALNGVVAGGVAAGVLAGLQRLVRRKVFSAAADFRPSVQSLGNQLGSAVEWKHVVEAVVGIVRGWLPVEDAQVLGERELFTMKHQATSEYDHLGRGEPVWTDRSTDGRRMLVPMLSKGRLQGVLCLTEKRGGALYNDDDMALLGTICAFGGLALHHAEALKAIDEQHRVEVGITKGDQRVAVDALAAEMAHELSYPLTYFRHLLRQAGAGQALTGEDVEVGSEELERLQRMLEVLRSLRLPEPRLSPVALQDAAERTFSVVRREAEDKSIALRLEVPSGFALMAEPDALLQLLANLVRNAVAVCPEGAEVGIHASNEQTGFVLQVWDTGPGIPPELEDRVFNHWVSARPGGTGLGLAISQRIARTLGWTLETRRAGGKTFFELRGPASSASRAMHDAHPGTGRPTQRPTDPLLSGAQSPRGGGF